MDTTNEYILELYQLKRSMTLKESTMKAYTLAVRDFLKYIPKPLTMVTKDDVEYFLREKQREGNNGASMNNKKRKINALFVWMKKQRFIRENVVSNQVQGQWDEDIPGAFSVVVLTEYCKK